MSASTRGETGSSMPTGGPGFTSFLAATSAFVFSVVYMIKVKPDLLRKSLMCGGHDAVETVEWVLVGFLLVCAIIYGICGFVKSVRIACLKTCLNLALPVTFFIAVAKAAILAFLYPPFCTIFELLWCSIFGAIMAMRRIETSEERREVRKIDASIAEVEVHVAKVMNELSRAVPQSAAVDSGSNPDGEHVQCAVCLVECACHEDVRTTRCGHSFHEECLRRWLTRQMCSHGVQTCAVCRRELTASAVVTANVDVFVV